MKKLKMKKDELLKKLEELKPWYQQIKFNRWVTVKSAHSKWSGEVAWKYIDQLLPDLKGKRVLDLGSNAGLFCVRCQEKGAQEVIGMERHPKHLAQAEFVKNYFGADKVNFLPFTLEGLPETDLGKFDVVLAIAVLYWVGRKGASKKSHYHEKYRKKEIEFIKHLVTITDVVIVRCRNQTYNNFEYYTRIFDDLGFKRTALIHEEESQHRCMRFERK